MSVTRTHIDNNRAKQLKYPPTFKAAKRLERILFQLCQYPKVIKIICIGRLKEPHYANAAGEYLKRLERYSRVEIFEIKEQTDKNVEVAKRKEAALITDKLNPLKGYFSIALDGRGQEFSSEEFAELLKKPNLAFVIGGPDGLRVVRRFLAEAAGHLKAEGRILLVISSLQPKDKLEALLKKHHFTHHSLASKNFFFEKLEVWELSSV